MHIYVLKSYYDIILLLCKFSLVQARSTHNKPADKITNEIIFTVLNVLITPISTENNQHNKNKL